jgi:hypothetical protein
MERLGLQRAAGFSWKKSARATLDVYKQVVAAATGREPAAPQPRRRARASVRNR